MPRLLLMLLAFALVACREPETATAPPVERASILLVTLDTTRVDAIGAATPHFNALAARGQRFEQAYATTPQTLPSHSSMMTGLYPGGHGVHENGRFLSPAHPVVAERLKAAGYRTGAFISAFALARRFGLDRGFEVYDEEQGEGQAERTAAATTARAMEFLSRNGGQPLFLWVHYYDPHYPYTPPEPFLSRHRQNPYLGEVASMDEQLGRLVAAFEKQAPGPHAIVVVSDHGEGLGDHGEAQHGNLLYQSTMHVPLVVVGPGVAPGSNATPVSTRRVFHTLLDFAGIDSADTLRAASGEPVVMGEAMKPFLDYGWQPQVMAVEGTQKAILAGALEVYDLARDPKETRSLAQAASLTRAARAALREYPVPSPLQAASPSNEQMSEEERRKLASLGYVASDAPPVVRKDAPRPADMTALFPILDRASGLFVREQYAAAIPLLEQIQAADPWNLDAALRLATAHSALGHDAQAVAAFRKAEALAPHSPDVRTYMALHYARGAEWKKAVPMLERLVAEFPDRLPPLEALAVIRERQQRFEEALDLRQRIYAKRAASAGELLQTGALAMRLGRTEAAIDAFERARGQQGAAFRNDLELGVLYLAARRYEDARVSLDRVPAAHPDYAMALFKRAQVSVLLNEPDRAARIQSARQHADATTRELIARERLFQ